MEVFKVVLTYLFQGISFAQNTFYFDARGQGTITDLEAQLDLQAWVLKWADEWDDMADSEFNLTTAVFFRVEANFSETNFGGQQVLRGGLVNAAAVPLQLTSLISAPVNDSRGVWKKHVPGATSLALSQNLWNNSHLIQLFNIAGAALTPHVGAGPSNFIYTPATVNKDLSTVKTVANIAVIGNIPRGQSRRMPDVGQ